MPATIIGPAFCRATLPRPGMMRSSAPNVLLSCGDARSCDSMRSRPSVGRNFSRLATVTRSWPSSRPRGERPSMPLATAMVSPCCTRAFLISIRPPAACNSRKRCRPRLRRKILQAAQHRGDVGIDRLAAAGCQDGADGGDELQHDLDHRIVLHRAGDHAAVEIETVRLEQVLRRPARSTTGCVDHDARRSPATSAGRAPRVCAWRQLAVIFTALARLGDRQRTDEFGGQHGRLPDLRRDQHVLGLQRQRRLVRLATRRRHRRSAPRCRTESRRCVCVAQV